MISEYEMQIFWNSEIVKNKTKNSVSNQWKEIEKLNELNISSKNEEIKKLFK